MPIRSNYQTVISTNTLYEVRRSAPVAGAEQLQPSIEVIGGSGVTIFGSQQEPVSAPTAMFATKTAFLGIEAFGVIPNYLYVQGTATTVTLSGVSAKAV